MLRSLSLAAAFLVTSSAASLAQDLSAGDWIEGKATVIDGDSIEVDGHLVRLFGIDAPEEAQNCYSGNLAYPCGAEATRYLSDMIYGQRVRCQVNRIDHYDRILGSCLWQGRNIAEVMVLSGQALAWPHHTQLYSATEDTARLKGAGIWATDFARPHEWRAAVARKKASKKD